MICGNPILAYVSSIGISFSIIYLVYNYLQENSFLEFYGKTTMIIFGFNYLINFIIYKSWNLLFYNQNIHYSWILQCIMQIILLGIFAHVYFNLKNRKSENKSIIFK